MKKVISLFLALTMVLALGACSGGQSAQPYAAPSAPAAS